LRLPVWQDLDCRPHLIDQRVAVANLLSLFDTGQSVPQRQQPLGAERGGVQILIRCNGNLAVIDKDSVPGRYGFFEAWKGATRSREAGQWIEISF
jgi:hypothetical protein